MVNNPNWQNFTSLLPEDVGILMAIQRGNEWLRALLYTFARRGTALRKRYSERSFQLLQILSPHPFYKGGQFLFDLLEWEDFIVDGHLPNVTSATFDTETLAMLGGYLSQLHNYLNQNLPSNMAIPAPIDIHAFVTPEADLPPIEPGFYLYQDVVLGLLSSIIYRQALRFTIDTQLLENDLLPLPYQDVNGFSLSSDDVQSILTSPTPDNGYQLHMTMNSLRLVFPADTKRIVLRLSAPVDTIVIAQTIDANEKLIQEQSIALTPELLQFELESDRLFAIVLIAAKTIIIEQIYAYRVLI